MKIYKKFDFLNQILTFLFGFRRRKFDFKSQIFAAASAHKAADRPDPSTNENLKKVKIHDIIYIESERDNKVKRRLPA